MRTGAHRRRCGFRRRLAERACWLTGTPTFGRRSRDRDASGPLHGDGPHPGRRTSRSSRRTRLLGRRDFRVRWRPSVARTVPARGILALGTGTTARRPGDPPDGPSMPRRGGRSIARGDEAGGDLRPGRYRSRSRPHAVRRRPAGGVRGGVSCPWPSVGRLPRAALDDVDDRTTAGSAATLRAMPPAASSPSGSIGCWRHCSWPT